MSTRRSSVSSQTERPPSAPIHPGYISKRTVRSSTISSANSPAETRASGHGQSPSGNIVFLTGEQRICNSLISKLLINLPSNTGRTLEVTESNAVYQETINSLITLSETRLHIVAPGLLGLLDKFNKETINKPVSSLTPHTLQSQLLVLKALSLCLTARWKAHHDSFPVAPGSTPLGGASALPRPWAEPPPLDESLARQIISLMVVFIRMTSYEVPGAHSGKSGGSPGGMIGTFGTRGTKATTEASSKVRQLHQSPSSSSIGLKYIKNRFPGRSSVVPSPLNDFSASSSRNSSNEPSSKRPGQNGRRDSFSGATAAANPILSSIAKYTGRIVFAVSACNWGVVKTRIASRIAYLSSAKEDHPDAFEIRLLEFSHLNRLRLGSVLQDLTSSFLHISRSAQPAIAVIIRAAIFNWIELYPAEYIALIQTSKRMEGSPEVLFDQIYQLAVTPEGMRRQEAYYPALAALLICCPEVLRKCVDEDGGRRGTFSSKKASYMDSLRKSTRSVRDIHSLICCVDFIRASSLLPPALTGSGVQLLAAEFVEDIKDRIFNPSTELDSGPEFAAAVDGVVALYRLQPTEFLPRISSGLFQQNESKQSVLVQSLQVLATEASRLPWHPPLTALQAAVSRPLRQIVYSICSEVVTVGHSARQDLLTSILDLVGTSAAFVLTGCLSTSPEGGMSPDDVQRLLLNLGSLLARPSPPDLQHWASKSLSGVIDYAVGMNREEDSRMQWSIAHAAYRVCRLASNEALFAIHTGSDVEPALDILRSTLKATTSLTLSMKQGSDNMADHESWADARQLCDVVLIASLPISDLNSAKWSLDLLISDDGANSLDEETSDLRTQIQAIATAGNLLGYALLQKKIRDGLRMAKPSATLQTVWRVLWGRWSKLNFHLTSSEISNAGLGEAQMNDLKFMGLLLAALAGVCHRDLGSSEVLRDTVLDTAELRSTSPSGLLQTFVNDELDLLVADARMIASAAAEILGSELRNEYIVKSMLLPQIDSLLEQCRDVSEAMTAFVEASINVLVLLERQAGSPPTYIGDTLLQSAIYLNHAYPDSAVLRSRLAVCGLLARLEVQAVDPVDRTAFQDIMMAWSQPPKEPSTDQFRRKLVGSLSKTSIEAYAKNAVGLKIAQSSDLTGHLRWLRTIANTNQDDHENVTLAVCHVLRSNNDLLPVCLSISFDDGEPFRPCLLVALGMFLREATIESLASKQPESLATPFSDLLSNSTHHLLDAVLACRSSNDNLATVIYDIFDRKDILQLFRPIVQAEMSATEDATQVLRSNSTTTRLVSSFARSRHAWNYFRYLLEPVVESLGQKPVEVVCQDLIDRISSSVPKAPIALRQFFGVVRHASRSKFPNIGSTPIGAVFFLRILCPALIDGERFDLEIPTEGKRDALIVSKLLNQLASGQDRFNSDNMKQFDHLLSRNMQAIESFLSKDLPLDYDTTSHAPEKLKPAPFDDKERAAEEIYLHAFIRENIDEISHNLCRSDSPELFLKQITELLAKSMPHPPLSISGIGSRSGDPSTVFYEAPRSLNNRRLFVVLARSFHLADHDFVVDLMKETLQGVKDEWDLLVDLTDTSEAQTFSASALEKLWLIDRIPWQACRTVALFQPNSLSKSYLRYHALIVSLQGTGKTQVVGCCSPSELLKFIPYDQLGLPISSLSLNSPARFACEGTIEHEGCAIPVTISVNDHLVVQTRFRRLVWPGVQCRISDRYSLADVDENFLKMISTPDKARLTQTILGAKSNSHKLPTRLLEPGRASDHTAAIIGLALQNAASPHKEIRQAALMLILECEQYLKPTGRFQGTTKILPRNISGLVLKKNATFAQEAKHLTLDYLLHWIYAFQQTSAHQRLSVCSYLGPWITNLPYFCDPASDKRDEYIERVKELLSAACDLTVRSNEDETTFLAEFFWRPISATKHEALCDMAVEEILRQIIRHEIDEPPFESLCDALVTFSQHDLEIRMSIRLRKAITLSHTPQATYSLTTNKAWKEISALSRVVSVLSHDPNGVLSSIITVPELVFVIVQLAGVGDEDMKRSTYNLFLNTLYGLGGLVERRPESEGIVRRAATAPIMAAFGLGITTTSENGDVELLGSVISLMLDAIVMGAPSIDISNAWTSRLTSLVASTCFQHNPATQARGFLALSMMIDDESGEVEDDLVYQILVAISGGLSRFDQNGLLLSMIKCLTKALPSLSPDSRYNGGSMFWLAVALIEIGHRPLFRPAVEMMAATLERMQAQGYFSTGEVHAVLLSSRDSEVLGKLDQVAGVAFEANFGFSIVSLLFKGLRQTDTAATVLRILEVLRVGTLGEGGIAVADSEALAYFLALMSVDVGCRTTLNKELGLSSDWMSAGVISKLKAPDNFTALLAVTLLLGMLNSCSSDAEKIYLYTCMSDAAVEFPEVVLMWYETLVSHITAVINHTENLELMQTVSHLLTLLIPDAPQPTDAQSTNQSESSLTMMSSLSAGSATIAPNAVVQTLQLLGLDGILDLTFGQQKWDRMTTMASWAAPMFCI